MLKCKDVAKKSSDFVEGRLSFRDKVAYYIHILICGNCRRYIQQFKSMLQQSTSIKAKPLTDDEAQTIVDKVCNMDKHES